MVRLITWNINSVRLRLPLLERLIDENKPDLVLLQETKVENGSFPISTLRERGFIHWHVDGMKAYNGVAILSRRSLIDPKRFRWCDRADCRHVAATLDSGVEIHCLYVPSGGDVPDPVTNPKFAHKLQFVDEMTAWWGDRGVSDRPLILAGDLNIAPLEHDVWSHKDMLDVVSHTPIEVEKLTAMQRSLDWVDVARHYVPAHEKLYSWWSYRAKDWRASDRGRRLDHVWVTQPLVSHLTGFVILKEARGWEPKPSDHVPVIIDLDL